VSSKKYIPAIDGLRAIAVLSVILFHAFPQLVPGGYIGVDIFFVISGYLITNIIVTQASSGTFSFKDFYARRIRRIFPALIIVLVSVYALGWFVMLADEFKQLGKHIAAGAGFVANWAYWLESGYFDELHELKPLLNLWSLGVEEQFYIFWPCIILLLVKFKSVSDLGKMRY
jgi:peptidoglycan/LPS O-acetylase OafA/YrhL